LSAHQILTHIAAAFGVSLAAAAAVYVPIRFLGRSLPLKHLVLDWLTQNDQEATLQKQFILTRDLFFGDRILSARRNLALSGLFLLFILGLAAFYAMIVFFPPEPEGNLAFAVIGAYASGYFNLWRSSPVASSILIAIAFTICHVCFAIFDYITLRSRKFDSHLRVYVPLLLIGYAACLPLLSIVGVAAIATMAQRNDQWLIESYANAISNIGEGISSLFHSLAETWAKRGTETGDLGDAFLLGIGLAIFGTMALCMSAVVVMTAIHLAYAFGLGVLRADRLLRDKYGYDQRDILQSPLEYAGTVMAIVIFVTILSTRLSLLLVRQF
jgi:hypothetical protein